MSFIEQYLLQLNTEKRRWRRAVVILTALSLVVALVTVWNLRMTGITIANGATCGQVEHRHTEECPIEKVLICGYGAQTEEQASSTAEQTPPEQTQHPHTDACYQITYQCGFEEHIHVLSCYSDATADVESAVIWEADLPELTSDWADDIVQIAQSQLGCGESERNYIVADDTQPCPSSA